MNASNTTARLPNLDDFDGTYRWSGTKNGAYAFFASLGPDGRSLTIWTKENNDYGAARHAQEASGLTFDRQGHVKSRTVRIAYTKGP